ncbi:MAG: hypothetical protein H6828_05270 [Planctomycetes bacterium]|nr:hypothetical protein [Planctomycetota bacterium]
MDDELRRERAQRGAAVLLAALFLVVAVVWSGKRDYEWDLLAYSACALELGERDPGVVHREVYARLERDAPPAAAEALRAKNAYRARCAAEPAAFDAQLPFYRGRVLYVGAIAALVGLGASPIDACFRVSWLGGVLVLAALWRWLVRRGGGSLATLLGSALALAALGVWFKTPVKATPDALAAGVFLWGAYLLLESRRARVGAALCVLALAARADLVVLVVPLLVLATLPVGGARRLTPAFAAGALVVAGFVVLGCTAGRGTYAPWVVVHHTFLGYKAFPAAETPPLDLAAWAALSLRSLPELAAAAPLTFLLAGLAALVAGLRRGGRRAAGGALALVALAATLAHFALFPAAWPRLLFPYWILSALALGAAGAQSRSSQASP